jgi:hypothetical protein
MEDDMEGGPLLEAPYWRPPTGGPRGPLAWQTHQVSARGQHQQPGAPQSVKSSSTVVFRPKGAGGLLAPQITDPESRVQPTEFVAGKADVSHPCGRMKTEPPSLAIDRTMPVLMKPAGGVGFGPPCALEGLGAGQGPEPVGGGEFWLQAPVVSSSLYSDLAK